VTSFDDWLNEPVSRYLPCFILGGDDGHQLIPVNAAIWAIWFEGSWPQRQVAYTQIDGDSSVSTVFIGVDVLFESLSFLNGRPDHMDRYESWDEALAGHQAMVDNIMARTT